MAAAPSRGSPVSDAAARWTPRAVAVVLAAALAVVIVVTTPWHLIDLPEPDATLDFTTAEIARQNAFRRELLPWSTTSWVLSVLVPLAIGFSPLGRRLYDLIRLRRWYVVVPLLVAGLGLARQPRHRADRRHGGAGQPEVRPVGAGLGDVDPRPGGQLAADVARARGDRGRPDRVGETVAHLVVVACGNRRRGALLGVSFAYPVLVEPRFNEFASMPAGAQRDDFMKAADDGVPVRDVLVADASKRTTALNAYVSGFGSTRRLVVYDTLLKDAPPAQVRLVVAHELGHAAEDDVLHGTLIGVLGTAFAVVLLRLLLGARMSDPRRTALLLALIAAGTVLAAPVQNLVSRRIEARADYHSLRLTNDPQNFVAMQHDLAVTNISGLNPSRWRYLMFASHPTAPERIAMGRAWATEHGTSVPPLVQR